jgi:hypothetical protein
LLPGESHAAGVPPGGEIGGSVRPGRRNRVDGCRPVDVGALGVPCDGETRGSVRRDRGGEGVGVVAPAAIAPSASVRDGVPPVGGRPPRGGTAGVSPDKGNRGRPARAADEPGAPTAGVSPESGRRGRGVRGDVGPVDGPCPGTAGVSPESGRRGRPRDGGAEAPVDGPGTTGTSPERGNPPRPVVGGMRREVPVGGDAAGICVVAEGSAAPPARWARRRASIGDISGGVPGGDWTCGLGAVGGLGGACDRRAAGGTAWPGPGGMRPPGPVGPVVGPLDDGLRPGPDGVRGTCWVGGGDGTRGVWPVGGPMTKG